MDHVTVCKSCGYKSITYEPSCMLMLPLPIKAQIHYDVCF